MRDRTVGQGLMLMRGRVRTPSGSRLCVHPPFSPTPTTVAHACELDVGAREKDGQSSSF